jgi:hypothetical protein
MTILRVAVKKIRNPNLARRHLHPWSQENPRIDPDALWIICILFSLLVLLPYAAWMCTPYPKQRMRQTLSDESDTRSAWWGIDDYQPPCSSAFYVSRTGPELVLHGDHMVIRFTALSG